MRIEIEKEYFSAFRYLTGSPNFFQTKQPKQFRFEKNERYKEFDGILRASHALEEATSTPVEALFDIGKMQHLSESVKTLTERIKGLTTPTYGKVSMPAKYIVTKIQEHEEYLAEVTQAQKAYVDLCRTEAQKKMKSAVNANRT